MHKLKIEFGKWRCYLTWSVEWIIAWCACAYYVQKIRIYSVAIYWDLVYLVVVSGEVVTYSMPRINLSHLMGTGVHVYITFG